MPASATDTVSEDGSLAREAELLEAIVMWQQLSGHHSVVCVKWRG